MPSSIVSFLSGCVRYYVNALLLFGDWALKFKLVQWFATNRVFILIGFYLTWIIVGDFFLQGSAAQQDWFFIGLSAYFLLEYTLKSYRMLRSDSFASFLAVLFFIPFLVYELYRQLNYSYEPFYFLWPLLFDVLAFLTAILLYALILGKKD